MQAWNARLVDLVKGFCGLRESTRLEVLPDIMPVLDLTADDPEYAFLRGERYLAAYVTSVAVAGQLSFVNFSVRNPVTPSRALVKLLDVQLIGGGNMAGQGYLNGVAGAGAGLGCALDTRDQRYLTAGLVYHDSHAGTSSGAQAATPGVAVGLVQGFAVGTSWSARTPLDIVLTPGNSFAIFGLTVNTSLSAIFRWEEHASESGDELRAR